MPMCICGELVDENTEECENCDAFRCPSCERMIPGDSNFCEHCGDNLDSE